MKNYLLGALCVLPLGLAACASTDDGGSSAQIEVPEGYTRVDLNVTGMT